MLSSTSSRFQKEEPMKRQEDALPMQSALALFHLSIWRVVIPVGTPGHYACTRSNINSEIFSITEVMQAGFQIVWP
jgi:hypothetical protein